MITRDQLFSGQLLLSLKHYVLLNLSPWNSSQRVASADLHGSPYMVEQNILYFSINKRSIYECLYFTL